MPIAAERDVHIIAEERAKRNVPSAPKLGCTFGNIGVIKVFKKAEAEGIRLVRQAEADGIAAIKAAGADHAVLTIRGYEALKDIAEGKATKIFLPSGLDKLSSVACAIAESVKDQPEAK